MRELIIDSFAGGGGASTGIEAALGLTVDIAINHDEAAIEMHTANHPATKHYCTNIWDIDPKEATGGKPVGLMWASPDCTHFSRAKGGKPVEKKIRGLAWVVVKWAKAVRPRVIILENVAEFQEWGPTIRQKAKGKGQNEKTLEYPDPAKKGKTFQLFINRLRGFGYNVQWRQLCAADYGAPTIRKRLFLIARCDDEPIVWPEPTHGQEAGLFSLKPYRAAAECIDWTIPCPSIFDRKRPLAENTLRRIAKGLKRYVIDAKEPFIVTCNHSGDDFRGQSVDKPLCTITASRDAHGLVVPHLVGIDHQSSPSAVWPAGEALRTITKENRFALVAPYLSKYHGGQAGEGRGQKADQPLRTQDTSNRFALVSAFLSKYFSGDSIAADVKNPLPTVTAIDHNALVTANLLKFYGTNIGSDMREPVPTITGQGQHIAEVRAFLIKYYGCGCGQSCREPLHTVTSKDRLGLVTVAGVDYRIADIGLRMLTPRELARAQGFPDKYILTGSKSSQVARIGNSVCPVMAEVLVRANVRIEEIEQVRVG